MALDQEIEGVLDNQIGTMLGYKSKGSANLAEDNKALVSNRLNSDLDNHRA